MVYSRYAPLHNINLYGATGTSRRAAALQSRTRTDGSAAATVGATAQGTYATLHPKTAGYNVHPAVSTPLATRSPQSQSRIYPTHEYTPSGHTRTRIFRHTPSGAERFLRPLLRFPASREPVFNLTQCPNASPFDMRQPHSHTNTTARAWVRTALQGSPRYLRLLGRDGVCTVRMPSGAEPHSRASDTPELRPRRRRTCPREGVRMAPSHLRGRWSDSDSPNQLASDSSDSSRR